MRLKLEAFQHEMRHGLECGPRCRGHPQIGTSCIEEVVQLWAGKLIGTFGAEEHWRRVASKMPCRASQSCNGM